MSVQKILLKEIKGSKNRREFVSQMQMFLFESGACRTASVYSLVIKASS